MCIFMNNSLAELGWYSFVGKGLISVASNDGCDGMVCAKLSQVGKVSSVIMTASLCVCIMNNE